MIVQTTTDNQPPFVIQQNDHAKTCGDLARAFGGNGFQLPNPAELLIYAVEHHDAGWMPIDARAEQSPTTGLPHHLTQTPLPYLVQTSKGSPDFNEAHHPFSGLLSSMHTYGLFNGRYGLSDFVFIDKMSEEHRPMTMEMLENELVRQERLRKELANIPETASWVDEPCLFTHYKLLQFFDTLGLYFQMTHADARTTTHFLNVPDASGRDHTLTITPQDNGRYHLSPYPFSTPMVKVQTVGRYLTPQPAGTDFKEIFATTPPSTQSYMIVQETAQ